MVVKQANTPQQESHLNLEALQVLHDLATGENALSYKQGPCEHFTFWLGSAVLRVAYRYTPQPTSWGNVYRRERGTFECNLGWEERLDAYPSSDGAHAEPKARTVTLEEALALLGANPGITEGRAA